MSTRGGFRVFSQSEASPPNFSQSEASLQLMDISETAICLNFAETFGMVFMMHIPAQYEFQNLNSSDKAVTTERVREEVTTEDAHCITSKNTYDGSVWKIQSPTLWQGVHSTPCNFFTFRIG